MNTLIACCGLNCEKCNARIATINNDEELRRQTAEEWSKMNNAPQITPETIHCMGCRVEGVKFAYCEGMCEVRACVLGNGYETCADCAEVKSCAKIAPFINTNEEVRKNLLG